MARATALEFEGDDLVVADASVDDHDWGDCSAEEALHWRLGFGRRGTLTRETARDSAVEKLGLEFGV